jgi:hypothetical protein
MRKKKWKNPTFSAKANLDMDPVGFEMLTLEPDPETMLMTYVYL